MKKYILGFIIALICSLPLFSQEVEFKVQAPKVVGKGERFKVSFVVNDDKPKHFIAPTFQDVNIGCATLSIISPSATTRSAASRSSRTEAGLRLLQES